MYYSQFENTAGINSAETSIFSDDEFEKILKDVFDGTDDEEIMKPLFIKTFAKINDAVDAGFPIAYNTEDAILLRSLKENIAVFSAFKSNHQASAMHELLINSNGERRDWGSFYNEAKQINPRYNSNWLRTEYDMAQRQARSAQLWSNFQRDKDVYPNLKYLPSLSPNPRDSHKKWYGVVKPIDDAFWTNAFPPNGWNCKCRVEQTRDDADETEIEAPAPIKGIDGNAGKSKNIYSRDHSFIEDCKNKEEVKKYLSILRENNTAVIKMKVGKNAVMIDANADSDDLYKNLIFAKATVEMFKKDFEINDHIEGRKNPEFKFLNIIGDRTEWERAKTISNYIDKTFKHKFGKDGQMAHLDKAWLGIDFIGKINKNNASEMLDRLNARLYINPKCKFVILKNNDNMLFIKNEKFDKKKMLDKIEKELL